MNILVWETPVMRAFAESKLDRPTSPMRKHVKPTVITGTFQPVLVVRRGKPVPKVATLTLEIRLNSRRELLFARQTFVVGNLVVPQPLGILAVVASTPLQ